jgi:hypothetical protein
VDLIRHETPSTLRYCPSEQLKMGQLPVHLIFAAPNVIIAAAVRVHAR